MDVERICRTMRELIAMNESSARLAREVMVAQEVADELEHSAELALDELRSGRWEEAERPREQALEEAISAVRSSDRAHAAEMAASTAYATHLERSRRVLKLARELVAELEPGPAAALRDALPPGRRPPADCGPRTRQSGATRGRGARR